MDFTNPENTAEGVTKLLEGLEVGILVNNVGMLYPNYEAPFLGKFKLRPQSSNFRFPVAYDQEN